MTFFRLEIRFLYRDMAQTLIEVNSHDYVSDVNLKPFFHLFLIFPSPKWSKMTEI